MALQIKVGSFDKTGTAPPVDQSVSWSTDAAWSVDATVETIIFWSEDPTAYNTFEEGVGTSLGFVSKTAVTDDWALWTGSNSGGAFGLGLAITDTWGSFCVATGASAFIGRTAESNAAVKTFDTNGFTLTWNPNHATPLKIHYMAFSGLLASKVVNWTYNTGPREVTGVGFCPDLLVNLGFVGAGDPGSALSSVVSLGYANHDIEQGMVAWTTLDTGLSSGGHNHSNCGRLLLGDRFGGFLNENDPATALRFDVEFTGMTTDGFTYTGTTHSAFGYSPAFATLCIKGVASEIGVTTKPTTAAPAAHSIALSGMTNAQGIVLTSVQDVTTSTPATHDRLGIGAWDGVTQAAAAHEARDDYVNIGAGPFGFDLVGICHKIARDDRLFIKVDNFTPSIDAAAVGVALNASSADLSWTTNDSTATALLYLVLGAGTAGVCEPIETAGSFAGTWVDTQMVPVFA